MKIQAVIFDWAGTVVDYGCHAPVKALEKAFAKRGIELLPQESRHGMGMLKLDQIREIMRLPRVRQLWQAYMGAEPKETAVLDLFEEYADMQGDFIEAHSAVIPGVPELVEKLRSAGIKIGSTTGYTRAMMNRLIPRARRDGFSPDCVVTPTETGVGRPQPWMFFENMKQLSVYPPAACLKVGDTRVDIQEGLNAGAVTIGVCESSSDASMVGPQAARQILETEGASLVVGTAPEIWEVLEGL